MRGCANKIHVGCGKMYGLNLYELNCLRLYLLAFFIDCNEIKRKQKLAKSFKRRNNDGNSAKKRKEKKKE